MLELAGDEEVEEEVLPPLVRYGNRGGDGYHCPGCGKFAKHVANREYYDGNFTCFSFDTQCKDCGLQTTECV